MGNIVPGGTVALSKRRAPTAKASVADYIGGMGKMAD